MPLIVKRVFQVILPVVLWVGCSDVAFSPLPSQSCLDFIDQYGPEACIFDPESGISTYKYNVQSGKVDLLFVVDNSRSMYQNQEKMAERFPDLINSIDGLDWQIAMITTDISKSPGNSIPRPANGMGAFQDGRFLKFPNGQFILKKGTPSAQQLFQTTVRREETLECDVFAGECPSGDERGIYALNMAIDPEARPENQSFFRPGAHLGVVILSDEDVRSRPEVWEYEGYALEPLDKPESFVKNIAPYLGATKVVSAHAIIVRPGDTACLAEQSPGSIKAAYGTHYAALAQPSSTLKSLGNIVDGVIGNICSNNYTKEMGDIGAKITNNVNMLQLACSPLEGSIKIRFTDHLGQPIQYSVQYSYNSSNKRVTFNPAAPSGSIVHLEYQCRSGQ